MATNTSIPTRVTEQRQHVVDAVIDAIAKDGLKFFAEWAPGARPHNPITGNTYRGINRINLAATARLRGFTDPRWLTFKQAKAAGLHVKKGARSAVVEKWKMLTGFRENSDGEPEPYSYARCVGYFSVFNCEEIAGIEPYAAQTRDDLDDTPAIRVADRLIKSSPCPVVESPEGRAFYTPATDCIHIPARGLFVGTSETASQNFARTLAHELTHATASRVGRVVDYAGAGRAFEELVAELGALFLTSDLGLVIDYDVSDPHFQQHSAYIQSWCELLVDTPAALHRAARDADAAARYLAARYEHEEHATEEEASCSPVTTS